MSIEKEALDLYYSATIEDLYKSNYDKPINEVMTDTNGYSEYLNSITFGRMRAKDYWLHRRGTMAQLLRLEANVRFMKGHPLVDQDLLLHTESNLAIFKERWNGIMHLLEIEFGEQFRKEEENNQWAEEQRREANNYYERGSCISCGGAGCVMCTGEN